MSLPDTLSAAYRDILLPLRAQAEVRNRWVRQRLGHLLPSLMARCDIDMWLVIGREYNEYPVLLSLFPEPKMSARRRTILVMALEEDAVMSGGAMRWLHGRQTSLHLVD